MASSRSRSGSASGSPISARLMSAPRGVPMSRARRNLTGSVAAVPAGRVDVGRPEQTDLVIDPQRLRREPCLVGEIADGERLPYRARCHAANDPPSPKGTVKPGVAVQAGGYSPVARPPTRG